MAFGKGCHLHLIDGSAYIFRAYHALPPLTRKSDGLPVGAVAGFCTILWNELTQGKGKGTATHIAVVFDHSAKTFRTELYPLYKAHRPEPEKLLQFLSDMEFRTLSKRVADKLKVAAPVIAETKGYEVAGAHEDKVLDTQALPFDHAAQQTCGSAQCEFYFSNLYASFVGFSGRASQYGRRVPSGLTLSAGRVVASHSR